MGDWGYEVDFLAVGEESKGGDAIALRYGHLKDGNDDQFIAIIDGGFADNGQALVDHVEEYYKSKYVDAVILTHPDDDHANGLKVVLDQLDVGELWMHKPWEHSTDINEAFREGRETVKGKYTVVQKSLERANELYAMAQEKGIPVYEPFAGSGGPSDYLTFLGPSEDYYEELLGGYQDSAMAAYGQPSLAEQLLRAFEELKEKALTRFREDWHTETLKDPADDATSAVNNSSAITLLNVPNCARLLLTGDAGVQAISNALDYSELIGIPVRDIYRMQVPHHGSRHNMGPTLLDRMVGPKLPSKPERPVKRAMLSCPKKGEKKHHPSKRVTNAYQRRGCPVTATKDEEGFQNKRFPYNAPDRPGWGLATPLPLYEQFEETDD